MKRSLLIILVILTGVMLTACAAPTPEPSDIGSEATISVPNLDTVHLALNKEALDLWTEACVAKDYIGMAQLESVGKVFPVPNGTRVLVINSAFAVRQVRVLEGNAYGRSGWLPYEWLK